MLALFQESEFFGAIEMHVDVSIVLFGSRLSGKAGPQSDYDVFLASEEFAANVVPQPLPHDQPRFYESSFGIVNHHQAKRSWSNELWKRLGGDQGIGRFRELAAQDLRNRFPDITPDRVDLFLHIPKPVSSEVYAVRLAWDADLARFDFAYDALRQHLGESPELKVFFEQLSKKSLPRRLQAIEIEKRLTELTGAKANDTYRQYFSLPELLRREPAYEEHAPMVEPL